MIRPSIFMVIAGLVASFAAYMVYSILKARDDLLKKQAPKLVTIAVATRNLPLGSKLDATSVAMVPWPQDHLPPGAITSMADVKDRILRVPVSAEQPIVKSALYDGVAAGGLLPMMIPPGMRAMSVQVDEVSGVAGFVMPHARVDVLVALHSTRGNESPKAKIVLENVEVLAIAQQLDGSDRQPQVVRVVTLLVTPEEAERLALASREGTLRLAIRRYDDHKVVNTTGTDLDSLLRVYSTYAVAKSDSQKRQFRPQAVRPSVQVEVMRGVKAREIVSFIAGSAATERVSSTSVSGENKLRASQTQGDTDSTVSSSFASPELFGPGAKTIVVSPPSNPRSYTASQLGQ